MLTDITLSGRANEHSDGFTFHHRFKRSYLRSNVTVQSAPTFRESIWGHEGESGPPRPDRAGLSQVLTVEAAER